MSEGPGVSVHTIGGRLAALPELRFAATARPEIERFRDACRQMAEYLQRNRWHRAVPQAELQTVLAAIDNVGIEAVSTIRANAAIQTIQELKGPKLG